MGSQDGTTPDPIQGRPAGALNSRRALLAALVGGAAVAGAAAVVIARTGGPRSSSDPGATPFVIPQAFTSAGVQAAVDQASQQGRGTVYLPGGSYTFADTVTVDKPISIISASDAVINLAFGTDGFLFRGYNGNGQQVFLPTINGGNHQVRLSGVATVNLYVGACQGGQVGVSIESVPKSKSSVATLDNNVFFQFIGNCTYGVQFAGYAGVMQGNVVTGNFITKCLHAVDFYRSTDTCVVSINIVDIAAIDGGGRTGATGLSMSGVDNGKNTGGSTFSFLSFFGGFDETVPYSYINFPSTAPSAWNTLTVRLGSMTSNPSGLDLINFPGPGNRLISNGINSWPSLQDHPNAIATVPATPSLAAYNNGLPPAANNLRVSCAVGALAANGYQDFYLYSPLINGYSGNVHASLADDGGYPFTVTAEDQSVFPGTTSTVQRGLIHLRLRSPIATQATTVIAHVQVGT